MKFCVQCGNELSQSTRDVKSPQIGEHLFTATAPARKCAKCGLEMIDGPSAEHFELLIAERLIASGIRTGAALRYIRKVLDLRAAMLATLLEVKPETVSRWENDKVAPERAVMAVLGAMVADRINDRTETLDRMRAMAEPKPLEPVVRIDLRIATPATHR